MEPTPESRLVELEKDLNQVKRTLAFHSKVRLVLIGIFCGLVVFVVRDCRRGISESTELKELAKDVGMARAARQTGTVTPGLIVVTKEDSISAANGHEAGVTPRVIITISEDGKGVIMTRDAKGRVLWKSPVE